MASFRKQGMLVWAHYFRNIDKGVCFSTVRFIDILIHLWSTLISQAAVLTFRPQSKCMHRLQNLILTLKKGRGPVSPYFQRNMACVTTAHAQRFECCDQGEGVSWSNQSARSCHLCMVKVTESGGGFWNLLGTCWHQERASFGMTFTHQNSEWQYWATVAHVSEI